MRLKSRNYEIKRRNYWIKSRNKEIKRRNFDFITIQIKTFFVKAIASKSLNGPLHQIVEDMVLTYLRDKNSLLRNKKVFITRLKVVITR